MRRQIRECVPRAASELALLLEEFWSGAKGFREEDDDLPGCSFLQRSVKTSIEVLEEETWT